jgi:predicted RNase H-like HicB family nuclease
MTRYGIVIVYSEEDAGFVAVAPELPGCTAFGGTEEEALGEIKTAISSWLEKARRESLPIPPPRGKEWLKTVANV